MNNRNLHNTMTTSGQKPRKKDSARLIWDSKPRRAPNPKDIEFQTAEVVIPNPVRDENHIRISFRDGIFGEENLDKQKMNRLIWGDNLLAMPPKEFKQSKEWEYLIISESLFEDYKDLGFDAFVPLCQGLRDKILAEAASRLFV